MGSRVAGVEVLRQKKSVKDEIDFEESGASEDQPIAFLGEESEAD